MQPDEPDTPPPQEAKSSKQYDYLFKLVLIGDSGVGKSSLLIRFARFKTVQIDGKNVRLQVWDTAGQERFRSITPGYYQSADGIIMAYAINDLSSFEHIEEWLDDVRKHAQPNVNIILVGNKSDLESERQVSQERMLKCNDAFVQLATELVRARSGKPQEARKGGVKLSAGGGGSKSGCCS